MLQFPKPKRRRRRLPSYIVDATRLGTAEYRALAHIANTADLVMVAGAPFLVFPADPRTLDTLAGVGAGLEDVEDNGDAEQSVYAPHSDPDDAEYSLGWIERIEQTKLYAGAGDDVEVQEPIPEHVAERLEKVHRPLRETARQRWRGNILRFDANGRRTTP